MQVFLDSLKVGTLVSTERRCRNQRDETFIKTQRPNCKKVTCRQVRKERKKLLFGSINSQLHKSEKKENVFLEI